MLDQQSGNFVESVPASENESDSSLPGGVCPEKLIYIVDDESLIGEVVEMVLKLKGFRPRFFVDPESALEALKFEAEKPVLLLTDFLMVPINGMELIERCKQIRPDLKTLLYSGNVGEEMTQHYRVRPNGFLGKPFLPNDLIAIIDSVLSQ